MKKTKNLSKHRINMVFPILICENNFHKIEKQVENLQKRERIFVYKFEINFYLWRSIVDKNDPL